MGLNKTFVDHILGGGGHTCCTPLWICHCFAVGDITMGSNRGHQCDVTSAVLCVQCTAFPVPSRMVMIYCDEIIAMYVSMLGHFEFQTMCNSFNI